MPLGSSERGAPSDYAALDEAIPDAIFSVDRKGVVFALNHIAEALSGYPREQLIGESIDILLPETLRADRAGYRELFVELPSTREMGVLAGARLRRKDGKEVPVEIKLSPIGKDGKFGVDCIVRDTGANHLREVRLRRHAKYQAALARLGHGALSSGSLEALMDDAVSTLASALDVEFCKVLKLAPDHETLLLTSGVGWKRGLVGRATVGASGDSQPGYTLLSGGPVIVSDLRTETRFSGPPLLTEHGIVSGISVEIRC